MSKILIFFISFYRRFISKHKGWHCAHSYFGHDTCSTFGLKVAKRTNFFKAIKLIFRRFDECKLSSLEIQKKNNFKRPHYLQRGDCDVGGGLECCGEGLPNNCGCDDAFDFKKCNFWECSSDVAENLDVDKMAICKLRLEISFQL